MTIWTPYYRTIVHTEMGGDMKDSIQNYTPYLLFCLKTKLYPHLTRIIGDTINIEFILDVLDDKMQVSINITDGVNSILKDLPDSKIKQIQDIVNKLSIDDNICVIFNSDTVVIDNDGNILPSNWIKEMLYFVHVDEKYNTVITENGIEGDLSSVINYTETYNTIQKNIMFRLNDMYVKGYIINAGSISKEWGLKDVDGLGELYYPLWKDTRILGNYNMVDFLRSRIRGNTDIRILTGENKVRRYKIAKILDDFVIDVSFDGMYTILSVNSLDDAQKGASLVCGTVKDAYGKVIDIPITRLGRGDVYIRASMNILGSPGIVIKNVENPRYPFIFTNEIHMDESISNIRTMIENEATKIVTKLKNDRANDPTLNDYSHHTLYEMIEGGML